MCRVYKDNIQGGGKLAQLIQVSNVSSLVAALDDFQRGLQKLHKSIPRSVPHHTLHEFQQLVSQGHAIAPKELLLHNQAAAEKVLNSMQQMREMIEGWLENPTLHLGYLYRTHFTEFMWCTLKWALFGGLPTMRPHMLMLMQVCVVCWCAADVCVHKF